MSYKKGIGGQKMNAFIILLGLTLVALYTILKGGCENEKNNC